MGYNCGHLQYLAVTLQHAIEQHRSNCCQLVHGAAVFAVRCISARWSAIQASQAVDVDGSRAKLTKLHCYNMLQQLASPTNEAQFFLENCEAMRILWPWHDRHDIAWNILKQSCSFNSFQVLMEVGIPVHFNFDGDAMLLELQAKLQGDFERHGRNTMPFKNCDRELQFVANNTSDLHWTFFRALSIAVDTFNILQQSSAFRNCRLGAAAPHRNPTECTVCSTESVMLLRAAEFGQALYSVRLFVPISTQLAAQICGLWPSWSKCSFTKWAALHGLATILRIFCSIEFGDFILANQWPFCTIPASSKPRRLEID